MPAVIAVSPTMRCNYNCQGCYSRNRATEDELTTAELNALFKEASELGVTAVVVTGGEPLLRDDLLDLIARRRRLLFILISNGTHITPESARQITRSGNIIKLISIEGFPGDTDGRRQAGAHHDAVIAMHNLRAAGACFGFAAMNTAVNTARLGSDRFIDEMAALGCSIGLFTEYVPSGPQPRPEWILDDRARDAFRRRVIDLRRRGPMALIQFPHDEYGPYNRCSAAGRLSLHINSQGGVEPCPFIPVAVDNIRHGGLKVACESSFLCSIRAQPALLQRQHLACSLYEHLAEIKALAEFSQAGPPHKIKKTL
ncbi:MAG: radical SAM protein [Bacillota bacterium]